MVDSGQSAAIIAFTMPVWAAVLSSLVLGEPMTRYKLAGLALGVAGLAQDQAAVAVVGVRVRRGPLPHDQDHGAVRVVDHALRGAALAADDRGHDLTHTAGGVVGV